MWRVRRLFRPVRRDRAISMKIPLAFGRRVIRSVVPNCGYIGALETGSARLAPLLLCRLPGKCCLVVVAEAGCSF